MNEHTIAEALKEAGYFTALVGKWHCGEWLEEHLPMQQGFMHQYGHYAWGIDYYTKTIVHNAPARFAVYDWHRNQRPLRELPVDGIDMTKMLFEDEPSPRDEIIFEVTGSVRLPTIRSGDYKLMGDVLFNVRQDPRETTDVADKHPEIVKKLAARLDEVSRQRPALGNKPLLMDPPLPYVYGLEENKNPPQWLKVAVAKVRATQPKKWAPGKTPWPQAPTGAHASKHD